MAEKKLTGKIARKRINLLEAPRPPVGVIDGFKSLGDATGIVSDVMDQIGLTGVVPASVLKPTITGACIVGPALTLRDTVQREHVYETAHRCVNKMKERGEEIKAKKEMPGYRSRRWVVELTHSWLNRFRKLLVRYEKLSGSCIALIQLAFSIICWRKIRGANVIYG
jgi:hypothetical protein